MTDEDRLADLAISDRGFVLDPHTGATFTLNPTGLSILRGLQAGLDRGALVAQLQDGFATDGADLARDVDEFLVELRRHGLLPLEQAGS